MTELETSEALDRRVLAPRQHLLSYDDVAEITGIPVGTIRYLRHKGRGPRGFTVGRRVRFTEADVTAWIADMRGSAA